MTQALTIFTPTYDREETLERLYRSLLTQSERNFKWHVIDDGSTDGTRDLIERLSADAPFPIRYTRKENGGKHRAYNLAVDCADTPLFMCLDSDDSLAPGAAALIVSVAEKCSQSECAGIVGYWRSYSRPEGGELPRFKGSRHTTLGAEYDQGFVGDTSLVFRTDVIRRYAFPEFLGEKFVTEDYVYAQLFEVYQLHVVDAVLTEGEYRPDGLSAQALQLKRDNPQGWSEYYALKSRLADNRRESFYYSVQSLCYSTLARSQNANRVDPQIRFPLLARPFAGALVRKRRRQYASLAHRSR